MTTTKKPDELMRLRVAGHSHGKYLRVGTLPGYSLCGDIYDGVSLAFEGQGGFVVSLAELTELVRLAGTIVLTESQRSDHEEWKRRLEKANAEMAQLFTHAPTGSEQAP